jgi:hypothetical protein
MFSAVVLFCAAVGTNRCAACLLLSFCVAAVATIPCCLGDQNAQRTAVGPVFCTAVGTGRQLASLQRTGSTDRQLASSVRLAALIASWPVLYCCQH